MTSWITDDHRPYYIALLRGVIGAVVIGAIALLTSYQTTDVWGDAIIVGAIAALTSVSIRFGLEGYIDSKKPLNN